MEKLDYCDFLKLKVEIILYQLQYI